MKAYGFDSSNGSPILIETETPTPSGKDLLVKIEAIAVNPVDTKVKASIQGQLNAPKIVGWDACGTVIATGKECELFKIGDRVFYAGDVTRPGCYASHQLIDERIVGIAPATLTSSECAAMPLTSITAWEALFSRMRIQANLDRGRTLLIIGGAGGVGSIAIQLAKQVAGLNVVASASREASAQWCRELGADTIVNHHDLFNSYRSLNIADPDYILCLADTDSYYDALCELVAPQGLICFVVTSHTPQNIDLLKTKSAGVVWEFMFTRPMFNTQDITVQHQILNNISSMLDAQQLKCTLNQQLGVISADSIEQAHHQLQEGKTIGKIVLSGFTD